MFAYWPQLLDGLTFSLAIVGIPSAIAMLALKRRSSADEGNRALNRLPARSRVKLFLGDVVNDTKSIAGQAIDISEHGASIRINREIPAGSPVFLEFPKYQLMGGANVKRCVRCRDCYILGVSFRGPLMRSIP